MVCEPGQHRYSAPDDRMRCHNNCRGHEREIVAACDPKRSIRPFAEPPTRRWDSASRARGELAGRRSHAEEVARISEPCWLRNDRQLEDGPRRWVRCIYLATVLAETLNPSLASSAWILR